MWVQYKQGEVITPQRQVAPQTHSLRYHTSDAASASETQGERQAEQAAPQGTKRNNVNSSDFPPRFKENHPEKYNRFTSKTLAKPRISSQALLFSDELQAITSPHIAQNAARTTQQQHAPHHGINARQHSLPKRDHALMGFACLYLLGTVASGVLYAMLSSTQGQYLSYYLSNFIETIGGASVVQCCVNLCSLGAVGLTIVVLLGLSAVGLPLLFVFLFLKGIGSGVLLLQFFAQYQWRGLLYYFASVGVADVFLATGLCLLACTAAQNASTLFQAAFGTQPEAGAYKMRRLLGQYLLLLFGFLVVCLLCVVLFRIFFADFQL